MGLVGWVVSPTGVSDGGDGDSDGSLHQSKCMAKSQILRTYVMQAAYMAPVLQNDDTLVS